MYTNSNGKADFNINENRDVDIYNYPNYIFNTYFRYSYCPFLDD